MSEPENIGIAMLCSGFSCICPIGCWPQAQNVVTTITSSQSFYTGMIKPRHGVKIIIQITSVSGTSPTLTFSISTGTSDPAIPIISSSSPISSTGTWVVYISEDGTITLNANGTLSTIGKVSMPVDQIIVNFTVGGTSPSFGISAWVEYD